MAGGDMMNVMLQIAWELSSDGVQKFYLFIYFFFFSFACCLLNVRLHFSSIIHARSFCFRLMKSFALFVLSLFTFFPLSLSQEKMLVCF
jgi:hypothetical protein